MKENSDNKIKNIRLQKQIDIEKINEESINRLILNEQRINEILVQYHQDLLNNNNI